MKKNIAGLRFKRINKSGFVLGYGTKISDLYKKLKSLGHKSGIALLMSFGAIAPFNGHAALMALAYIPPVNTDEEVNKTTTDHNQVKNTGEVYKITAKDMKKNLTSLDKKIKENFDAPDQVEISGPDTLHVDEVQIYDVANPADLITASSDAVLLSNTGDDDDWWPGTNGGVNANLDGKIYVKGVTAGSVVTLHNVRDSSDPDKNITIVEAGTPITLKSFDVLQKDGHPVLSWVTGSETNNDYFEIQRSVDGKTFETIDTVNSQAKNGMSRAKLTYSYTDTSDDLVGTVYYRLKQVDKDGQSETFDKKTVFIEKPGHEPILYPNPVENGQVTLEIFNRNQNEYRIVNMHGQAVAHGSLDFGQNNILLSSLPAGEYSVQIKGRNKALKLIVQ